VIRGFALVLILGVVTSMFSAIVVTRTILRVVVRQTWARKASWYGLRDDEFAALGAVRPATRREARARV
jgi:preprotein translocase subunit SecD